VRTAAQHRSVGSLASTDAVLKVLISVQSLTTLQVHLIECIAKVLRSIFALQTPHCHWSNVARQPHYSPCLSQRVGVGGAPAMLSPHNPGVRRGYAILTISKYYVRSVVVIAYFVNCI